MSLPKIPRRFLLPQERVEHGGHERAALGGCTGRSPRNPSETADPRAGGDGIVVSLVPETNHLYVTGIPCLVLAVEFIVVEPLDTVAHAIK